MWEIFLFPDIIRHLTTNTDAWPSCLKAFFCNLLIENLPGRCYNEEKDALGTCGRRILRSLDRIPQSADSSKLIGRRSAFEDVCRTGPARRQAGARCNPADRIRAAGMDETILHAAFAAGGAWATGTTRPPRRSIKPHSRPSTEKRERCGRTKRIWRC